MSESEVNGSYNYPTSILTEISPNKAALILPNVLNSSQQINDNLLNWFNNYNSTVINYNNQLKRLIEDGTQLLSQSPQMGNFNKYWNCLLTSLQLESQTNDLLVKNFRNDILTPLKANKDDVKLSELLINSQELQETSHDISSGKSNAEIQWNYKAPQIFQNFENYKSYEFQLLFNVILNYFQIHNAKLSKTLQNNENSSNYLVSNFKLDLEMQQYLDYILKADFKPVDAYGQELPPAQANHAPKHNKRLSSLGSSLLSHDSKLNNKLNSKNNQKLPPPPIPTSEKRQSKLKSRVGSIFSRKKKPSKVSTSETVPEDASLYSNSSRPITANESTASRRASIARSLDTNTRLSEPAAKPVSVSESGVHQKQSLPPQSGNQNANPQFYTNPSAQNRATGGSSGYGSPSKSSSAVYPIQESSIGAGQTNSQPLDSYQALQPRSKAYNGNNSFPQDLAPSYQANEQAQPLQSNQQQFQNRANQQPFQNRTNQQFADPSSSTSSGPSNVGIGRGGAVAGAVVGAVAATAGVVGGKYLSEDSKPQQNWTQPGQSEPFNVDSTSSFNNDTGSDPFASNEQTNKIKQVNAGPSQSTAPIQSSPYGQSSSETAGNQYGKTDNSGLPAPSTPRGLGNNTIVEESPNFVKYNESESSDDNGDTYDQPNKGRGLSMLERHDLADKAQPVSSFGPSPASTIDGAIAPRSRQSSDKYSFEVGDEKAINERAYENDLPEPDLDGSSPKGNLNVPTIGSINKPPPPPSRKVIHHDVPEPTKRSEVNSQVFQNLPKARDSVIHPRNEVSSIPGLGGLIAQNTGNSLLKHDLFKHFDAADYVSLQGLNSSIAEVINVTFKDGQPLKAQLIGEIAFNYKLSDNEDMPPREPITLEIPNSFDKLILNHDLLENVGNDIFKLIPVYITSKTLGGLKYLVKLQESQIPIIIQQIWKYENHQASLMINLKLNPNIKTKVLIENLIVSVALNNNVESTSASSKPQGSFNKEKSRITWRYNQPLTLGGNAPTEEKLIARFMTNGKASEHESGIQIKFQIHEPPFQTTKIIDHNSKQEIPVVRNLISGNYSGHE